MLCVLRVEFGLLKSGRSHDAIIVQVRVKVEFLLAECMGKCNTSWDEIQLSISDGQNKSNLNIYFYQRANLIVIIS